MSQLEIRHAKETECDLVLSCIKGIAEYEHLLDQVETTEEMLHQAIFVDKTCQVLLGFENQKLVGFALYFYNFSTFKGKKGLYLEDLFIYPEYRGKGYGKQMITSLMKIAKEQHCGRMEWVCLDWNQSAITFYENLGAKPLSDWTIYRLDEKDL